MGVATLRVIYANDTWAIIQGIVYLSRFVWFAYAAIWIGNEWNFRLTPVSTSACAWSTVVVTLLLVRFVGAVKIVFAIFSFTFNSIDMDEMLDVTICTVGAYGMYFVIPLALSISTDVVALHRKAAARSSERHLSSLDCECHFSRVEAANSAMAFWLWKALGWAIISVG
ncbi:hypothetical protein AC1031_002277 [Aphanomyces cochlioides]|nr:hypothetical protein AC1031_002277 [Aphanomyces cochlioides]